jgi:hypothetical protein
VTTVAAKKSSSGKSKTGGKKGKAPKLGSGKRFKQVAASAAKSGARDPNAVAASVGRKKYGAKKMAAMSAAGRKRKGGGKKK